MIVLLIHTILAILKTRHQLAVENLALRHQIQVLQRSGKRPRLTRADRGLWVILSRTWRDWRDGLFVVKPDTVLRWHRMGFKLYWKWKSRRSKRGRPHVSSELTALIRKISLANPLWGAPRIHGELLKLGIDLAQSTVSKYMRRPRRPPSQTWETFLRNQLGETASIDLFTVPTATFRVLYVFFVLAHKRRRVLHFNVTKSPSATWMARQLIEAFPRDTAPKFILRDRDSIYGYEVVSTIHNLCVEQVLTSPRSPSQNPYVERVIASIRRECLFHVIVVNESHLRKILKEYFRYYIESRTHLALDKDCPEPRMVEPPKMGKIVAIPHVRDLHHRYTRIAARGLAPFYHMDIEWERALVGRTASNRPDSHMPPWLREKSPPSNQTIPAESWRLKPKPLTGSLISSQFHAGWSLRKAQVADQARTWRWGWRESEPTQVTGQPATLSVGMGTRFAEGTRVDVVSDCIDTAGSPT